VPVAFWEAVSAAEERSSARIASRIIAVWDVTTRNDSHEGSLKTWS
jgi:hypothetical protein